MMTVFASCGLRLTLPCPGTSRPARIGWLAAYTLFYVAFATHWWMWLLLPFHFVIGPIHGAIVNWCGHRYGYRNFESDDVSRNTLIFDFITMGELFQNNHHKYAMRSNFAVRAFELDPTYQVMRVFNALGIIKMKPLRELDAKGELIAPGMEAEPETETAAAAE